MPTLDAAAYASELLNALADAVENGRLNWQMKEANPEDFELVLDRQAPGLVPPDEREGRHADWLARADYWSAWTAEAHVWAVIERYGSWGRGSLIHGLIHALAALRLDDQAWAEVADRLEWDISYRDHWLPVHRRWVEEAS